HKNFANCENNLKSQDNFIDINPLIDYLDVHDTQSNEKMNGNGESYLPSSKWSKELIDLFQKTEISNSLDMASGSLIDFSDTFPAPSDLSKEYVNCGISK